MIAKLLILFSLIAVLYAVPVADSTADLDPETRLILEAVAALYNWTTDTLQCVIQCMQGNKGILDNYAALWSCAGKCL